MSRRARGRVEEKLAIKTGNAETVTNARAIATADIRNAVSYALMNMLMTLLVSPYRILNADATQHKVGYDSDKKIQVKYVDAPNGPQKVQPD